MTLATILFVALSGLLKQPAERKVSEVGRQDLPDFRTFPTTEAKKANFFGFLRPVVRAENSAIRRTRERLADRLAAARDGELSAEQWAWLRQKAERYRVDLAERDRVEVAETLLRKVDVVPVSLVLAQAAKESAWGTSRFARQGNNLFGEWCFAEGCGMVPARREAGKRHEVEAFATVRASVASYLHNLNSHPRYRQLRDIRARLRAEGKPVTGLALAGGLQHYSEQGEKYVSEVRAMIRHNNLGQAGES